MITFTWDAETKKLHRLNGSRETVTESDYGLRAVAFMALLEATDIHTTRKLLQEFLCSVIAPRAKEHQKLTITSEEIKTWLAFRRERERQNAN
jgi:hypothetical protein